jgi:hypothetical protein
LQDVPARLQDVPRSSVQENSDAQERLPESSSRDTVVDTDVTDANTDVTDVRDVNAQRRPDVPPSVPVSQSRSSPSVDVRYLASSDVLPANAERTEETDADTDVNTEDTVASTEDTDVNTRDHS